MRFLLSVILFMSFGLALWAGPGDRGYEFLSLPVSSRVSALGGANVSVQNNDLNMAFQNPSMLSGDLNMALAVNYFNHIAGVNYGNVAYSQSIDSVSFWAGGVSYLNYGTFEGYSELGVADGEFSAGDVCVSAIYARKLSRRITAGIAFKPVFSYIESYTSFGFGVDVGANFYDAEHDFSLGLVVKNFGVQIKGYTTDARSSLPWDLQVGLTKRLAHAPFRVSLTMVKLNDWDLGYNRSARLDDDKINLMDEEPEEFKISFGDMLLRHAVVGLEFIPSKNFNLQVSYNHRRRKEFALKESKGASGWAFGANIHVYKLDLGVSYAINAPKGGVFGLSVVTDLDLFK